MPRRSLSTGSDPGPCPGSDRGGGRSGTTTPRTRAWRWLCACAAAHGQDAGRVVAVGLQEALQSALQAWAGPPLSQREDAGRVVARAVQQLVEAAGARLLAAAVGQGLRGRAGRQQRGRQQQQQQQRHGGPGDLGRRRPGAGGRNAAPASSPCTQALPRSPRAPSWLAPLPGCPFRRGSLETPGQNGPLSPLNSSLPH